MTTYFDHNATTPLDPQVREEMSVWLDGNHGNPSSVHAFGRKAWQAIEEARERVALLLDASPQELVFMSSGTEANNSAVRACARESGPGGHIVISGLEHPSVTKAVDGLEQRGFEVTRVSPERDGVVDAEKMSAAIRDHSVLACFMLANNEIGTLQPVAELARLARQKDVPVLCDAVQAVGKIPVSVQELGADYLSLGAHKFYGPTGAAALWVRKGARFSASMVGGSQERRRRAGTVNVPAVAGLGKAAELACQDLDGRRQMLSRLRQRFESGLDSIPGTRVHGALAPRLPNTSLVQFEGADSESLLIRLDLAGFAVSAGSACSSGSVEPSDALLALGLSRREALSCLRFSFGITNTLEEVDRLLPVLERQLAELRHLEQAG